MDHFGWFRTIWSYDTTVIGAQAFLDKVRELYHGGFKKKASEHQISYTEKMLGDDCPIRFVYFCQNQQNDKLFSAENRAARTYINMNARGKKLSEFENLKALIDGSGEKGRAFTEAYEKTYINHCCTAAKLLPKKSEVTP